MTFRQRWFAAWNRRYYDLDQLAIPAWFGSLFDALLSR